MDVIIFTDDRSISRMANKPYMPEIFPSMAIFRIGISEPSIA
tara:strand:- start:452 stop:577 length:126 start_codon:yes stop_codon:yes gene_type:complete